MTTTDEVLQTVLSASPERKKEALRLLRGEAVTADPQAAAEEPYLTLRATAKQLSLNACTPWRWQVALEKGTNRRRLAFRHPIDSWLCVDPIHG